MTKLLPVPAPGLEGICHTFQLSTRTPNHSPGYDTARFFLLQYPMILTAPIPHNSIPEKSFEAHAADPLVLCMTLWNNMSLELLILVQKINLFAIAICAVSWRGIVRHAFNILSASLTWSSIFSCRVASIIFFLIIASQIMKVNAPPVLVHNCDA